MTRTLCCVECGEPWPDGKLDVSGNGRMVSGHVHRGARTVLATYCAACANVIRLHSQRSKDGGCEGCLGAWIEHYGEAPHVIPQDVIAGLADDLNRFDEEDDEQST